MRTSPPLLRRPQAPAPPALSTSAHDMSTTTTTSASSSRDTTAGPLTPLDADEEFIDQLWAQVRSKSKSSVEIARPSAETGAEERERKEGKVVKSKSSPPPGNLHVIPMPEQDVAVGKLQPSTSTSKPTTSSRLSHKPSLTFRESRDSRNTLAILTLPGVQKPDVHVSFQYKRLIVSYKSVEESEKWETDKVIQEVRERRCVRAIPIPESVRPEHIRASMPDHRLFISYPKS